ncbi:GntR family transcriptional regulator [Streptomyces olivoreticuli]|uniref:GntR family transcriptional regulator n=1 Tax=Streptomyces olivoreticuli TaxID=68246 RepID=UPI000E2454B0|nr:GntR family transcriptional regulator [Streptomyces olivoreticuli]
MEQGRPHGAPPRPGTGAPGQAIASATHTAPTGHVRGEHVHSQEAYGEDAYGAPAAVPAPRPAPARRMPQRYSVRGQILDALRRALLSGELIPGEVYSGPALGERFGVSATPVREAMQQLVLEGAVEVVPNRGFRVTRRTARDIAELAEVRALLEVPAVLRLARTAPAARWAGLRPLAETAAAVAATGDRAHYAEADRAFHRALLDLSGNRQLVTVAEELHRRAQWPAAHGLAVRTSCLVADAAEHLALLDALAAGDLPRVEALVTGHFTGAR